MKRIKIEAIIALMIMLFTSCNNGIENTSIGLDSNYSVPRLQKLVLATGAMGEAFKWEIISESGDKTTISEDRECIFVAEKSGNYTLLLNIKDNIEEITETATIVVLPEEIEYKASMTKVLDFNPAPGQFINDLPEYEEGDTKESIRKKTEEYLLNGSMVSLGAFGGYIIVGFDHTIINREGVKDFFRKFRVRNCLSIHRQKQQRNC